MTNTFAKCLAVLGIALSGLMAMPIHAAISTTLNYQGTLTNSQGQPVTNAGLSMTFSIYVTPSGGSPVHTETQTVAVNNGLFNVTLQGTGLQTFAADGGFYLGISVGGDTEMTPRQPIAASAQAFRAKFADEARALKINDTTAFRIDGNNNFYMGLPAGPTAGGGGNQNTGIGLNAMVNTQPGGVSNTALGFGAMQANTLGDLNVAVGTQALAANLAGQGNTAVGMQAMLFSTSGSSNVAIGRGALTLSSTGSFNVAVGSSALADTTGSNNIAVGNNAGTLISSGEHNIVIGHNGQSSDANTTRIGTAGNQTRAFIAGVHNVAVTNARDVVIDANGQLGTSTLQRGEFSPGTAGATGVNTYTINFPTAFAAIPKVIVTPKLDLDVNDTFAVTVRSISNTQFKVNVYRVDVAGSSWSANLRLEWQAWN